MPTDIENHDDMTLARPRERLEHHNARRRPRPGSGLDEINPDHIQPEHPGREPLTAAITAEAFDQGRQFPPVAQEELDGFSEGPLPPA